MQSGLWPGLAVTLICLGVLFIGIGIAAQITTEPKRSENCFSAIGLVLLDPSGWPLLVIWAGEHSAVLGVALFLCYMQFVVLFFLGFEAEEKDEESSERRLIGRTRYEQSSYDYRDWSSRGGLEP